MRPRAPMLATLLLCIVFGANSQQSHPQAPPSTQPTAWSEYKSGLASMHAAMSSLESTHNDDADFVRLMLPHHQAAIDMAKVELQYGKDPQMRRLAQEIITDQQSEIDLMQLWQKQHGTGAANTDSNPAKTQ